MVKMSEANEVFAKSLAAPHCLEGHEFPGGWRVIEKVQKEQNSTGGHFSVCYLVEGKDGQHGFLKVLDLAKALAAQGDRLKQIEQLIQQFNFERDLLDTCKQYRLKRVASAIAHGKLEIEGNPFGVYYIIFERAEGDIRKQLSKMQTLDIAWVLRTLHQTTVALRQLHYKGIAHQDVKPSNVLSFGADGAKVSDLGCADVKDKSSPRSGCIVAGDTGYAPPELLYGDLSSDWSQRRLGTDLYLLGGLIVFIFAHITPTARMVNLLHQAHRPGFWPHDYRTVLPYVRDAFGKMMEEVRGTFPPSIQDDLSQLTASLCDPDPQLRGHPKDLDASQFNLERFISRLDYLAKKAELGMV
jgi:eukaryotic-like serine/threonine-protein kinase